MSEARVDDLLPCKNIPGIKPHTPIAPKTQSFTAQRVFGCVHYYRGVTHFFRTSNDVQTMILPHKMWTLKRTNGVSDLARRERRRNGNKLKHVLQSRPRCSKVNKLSQLYPYLLHELPVLDILAWHSLKPCWYQGPLCSLWMDGSSSPDRTRASQGQASSADYNP